MRQCFPRILLTTCHRPKDTEGALSYNVHNFSRCFGMGDLGFDVSGETGVLRLLPREGQEPLYQVTCGDRKAVYDYDKVLRYLAPAYAATVHKAQGSEYDTVLFPVSKRFSPLLTRNLFYTAISRAKKRVILVGDSEALEYALKNFPAWRYSMLAEKVERSCLCRA